MSVLLEREEIATVSAVTRARDGVAVTMQHDSLRFGELNCRMSLGFLTVDDVDQPQRWGDLCDGQRKVRVRLTIEEVSDD